MLCHQQVSDMEGFQSTQSKALEDEVAEKALADMLQHHPEAIRLCVDELKDKNGQSRQYGGIIVADNCVKVVEVRVAVLSCSWITHCLVEPELQCCTNAAEQRV
jgi:hypothetical protein